MIKRATILVLAAVGVLFVVVCVASTASWLVTGYQVTHEDEP